MHHVFSPSQNVENECADHAAAAFGSCFFSLHVQSPIIWKKHWVPSVMLGENVSLRSVFVLLDNPMLVIVYAVVLLRDLKLVYFLLYIFVAGFWIIFFVLPMTSTSCTSTCPSSPTYLFGPR